MLLGAAVVLIGLGLVVVNPGADPAEPSLAPLASHSPDLVSSQARYSRS
jgi:hypothetical protein